MKTRYLSSMGYLFKKKLKEKLYLFEGANTWKAGRSVRAKSKYLGPYEKFKTYFARDLIQIEHQRHAAYGLPKALFEISKHFQLERIFKNNLRKKTEDPYLAKRLLAIVLNRLAAPSAKYSVQKWFEKTDLPLLMALPVEELDEQKVYRAMDQLGKVMDEIEMDIAKAILILEKIRFDMLYLDFTNQETYSENDSGLLQHGHNKRGKDELLQVNISLCCDAQAGIPFFHKSYAGNENDKQFIKVYASELRRKLEEIGWKGRSTLVIDRGINGRENFELLRAQQFDYIGGLIESEYPKYWALPLSRLRNRWVLKRKGKPDLIVRYTFRTDAVYGAKHVVVISYNPENREDQIKNLNQNLEAYKRTCEEKLREFGGEIREKTFQSYWNNVEKIRDSLRKLNKKLYPLLDFQLDLFRFELKWSIARNEANYQKCIEHFGRYVLFTNRLDLKPKQVLEHFHWKSRVERNFQILKANAYTNRYVVLGPMLHSKDERIRVHVYLCFIALQLYQVMAYRLAKHELGLSVQQVIEELKEITRYYTRIFGLPEEIVHVNPLNDLQRKIVKALEVEL